jgi:pimeloyl-ACP methyl ester carboxylesterase
MLAVMEELEEAPVLRRLPLAVSIGNRLISRELIDRAFRWRSAAWLANGVVDRLVPVGLPRADGEATLRRIRAWDAWPGEWEQRADRYVKLARDTESAAARRDSSRAAALAYHAAQLLVYEPVERKRALAHRAVEQYRSVAPLMDPPSERFELPYRAATAPGYFSLPPGASSARPAPLVVFFNGGSTVKEELNGWRDPFLAAGMATLALDNPGTGETWAVARFVPNQFALLDALRAFVADQPALDGRIALVGVSLGGMLAVHLASVAPDIAAVVTITPPFAPGEYITRMPLLTQWEVVHVTGFPIDCQPYLCTAIGLAPLAAGLRMPLLVVGAGRDRVVPPQEARRLYDAATPPRTLHWYPRAAHCCFSHLPLMLGNTARWLRRVLSAEC